MLFELWVAGKLGMHKNKPLLMAVFDTATRAEGEMIKILLRGDCAFVVKKKIPKTI